jgi:hypothetical protein
MMVVGRLCPEGTIYAKDGTGGFTEDRRFRCCLMAVSPAGPFNAVSD